MSGIAGLIVSSKEMDSEFLLQKMSDSIKHRRCESFQSVAHDDSRCLIVGPRSLQRSDDEIFIIDKNADLAFSEDIDDVTSILEIFGVVAVVISNNDVSLIRTLDGTRTLYYGNTKNLFAFATERKSLWRVGMTAVNVLEPGQGLTLPWEGVLVSEKLATLEKPTIANISREETLAILKKALLNSFNRLGKDTSCAILFSGGVDSSLAAVLAAKRCRNTVLVTARGEGTHDEIATIEAADTLSLPLHTVELNSKIIWDSLPELIYSIETSNQIDIEIALPFYLATRSAAVEGCTTVISGQGPDELFAGYAKHVRTFIEKGPAALSEQLWNEVAVTYKTNIERDERAIAAHGVESFFPYLDQKFVRNSLSVPIEWKVIPDGEPQRKVIFRELAQKLGVPNNMALAQKSATQYSSGSSKLLLESIIEHVDEFRNMRKKEASRRTQEVLDEIAYRIQMPTVPKKETNLHLDLKAVNTFLDTHPHLSSSSSNQM
jgi:asparagine synthetase B (glutamine-hydrolysing)